MAVIGMAYTLGTLSWPAISAVLGTPAAALAGAMAYNKFQQIPNAQGNQTIAQLSNQSFADWAEQNNTTSASLFESPVESSWITPQTVAISFAALGLLARVAYKRWVATPAMQETTPPLQPALEEDEEIPTHVADASDGIAPPSPATPEAVEMEQEPANEEETTTLVKEASGGIAPTTPENTEAASQPAMEEAPVTSEQTEATQKGLIDEHLAKTGTIVLRDAAEAAFPMSNILFAKAALYSTGNTIVNIAYSFFSLCRIFSHEGRADIWKNVKSVATSLTNTLISSLGMLVPPLGRELTNRQITYLTKSA